MAYEIWARKDRTVPLFPDISFRVSSSEFLAADEAWSLYKDEHGPEEPPSHHNWRWKDKADEAGSHLFVALKFAGQIEGMMMIRTEPQPCRLGGAEGEMLLYVEYLETAPWNQKAYAGVDAKLIGVGSCLIDIAIDLSDERLCQGRLGLHSLQDARGFYEDQGFSNLGLDVDEELDYFELGDRALGNTE